MLQSYLTVSGIPKIGQPIFCSLWT